MWVVTRHQYGVSALLPKTSFRGKTSGDVAKCRLFCQSCEITEKGIYIWFVLGGCHSIPRVSTVDG